MKSILMELWMILFGIQFVLLAGIKSIILNNPSIATSIVILFGISLQTIGLYQLDKYVFGVYVSNKKKE